MPRVPRSQHGTADDPYVGRSQSLSEVAENIRLAGSLRVPRSQAIADDYNKLLGQPLNDPTALVFQGSAGRDIERGVREFPVKSRVIEVVGPTSEVWKMGDRALDHWVIGIAANESLVWLDPPTEGGSWGEVQLRLESAGVTVRVKKAAAVDAVLPEVTVATPAQINQSIRGVVFEMAFEATQLTNGALHDVLEEMLSGEGL